MSEDVCLSQTCSGYVQAWPKRVILSKHCRAVLVGMLIRHVDPYMTGVLRACSNLSQACHSEHVLIKGTSAGGCEFQLLKVCPSIGRNFPSSFPSCEAVTDVEKDLTQKRAARKQGSLIQEGRKSSGYSEGYPPLIILFSLTILCILSNLLSCQKY